MVSLLARSVRFASLVGLTLLLSGCFVARGDPDGNVQERFEFVPAPVNQAEARARFEDMAGPESTIVEGSFKALGRIPGPRGDQYFADFQLDSPPDGLSQCSGQAGDSGGSWGCGPVGDFENVPDDGAVSLRGSGIGGAWQDASFAVSDEVAYLVATADDGTRYRLEPVAGMAWFEWKSLHGDVRVTAFDRSDNPLETIDADPGP